MSVASKHLAGEYEVVGVVPGEIAIAGAHQFIDLRTIDLETAHALYKAGNFPYLKKVEKAAQQNKEEGKKG